MHTERSSVTKSPGQKAADEVGDIVGLPKKLVPTCKATQAVGAATTDCERAWGTDHFRIAKLAEDSSTTRRPTLQAPASQVESILLRGEGTVTICYSPGLV
jgi:hypothetical protein